LESYGLQSKVAE